MCDDLTHEVEQILYRKLGYWTSAVPPVARALH